MRKLAIVAMFLVSPALAQDANQADIDAMTAAIEDAGCIVTVENGDAVLETSGLTEEQTFAVIAALYAAGQVALTEDGSMKLTNEACQ